MSASLAVNSASFKVSTPSPRAIELTRLFDASPELLSEAMTKPKHIKHWWGNLGAGYSVPVCEVDLRVGGKWKFTNRTPKGESVTFYGEYLELDLPRRMVSTEIYEPFPDSPSTVTVVLTKEKGKTRMTMTAEYPSQEVRDFVISTGMEKGAALSYDRLEDVANGLGAA